MLYQNDVGATVEVDFEAEAHYAWERKLAMYEPHPSTCVLTLEGQAFDLCRKDAETVLQEMRRHLWTTHDGDMRDQASVEIAEDFREAAE